MADAFDRRLLAGELCLQPCGSGICFVIIARENWNLDGIYRYPTRPLMCSSRDGCQSQKIYDEIILRMLITLPRTTTPMFSRSAIVTEGADKTEDLRLGGADPSISGRGVQDTRTRTRATHTCFVATWLPVRGMASHGAVYNVRETIVARRVAVTPPVFLA